MVTRHVVLTDWLLPATTVVIQPLTGIYLMKLAGMPLQTRWIMWSYALAVACWLPVVWLQMRLRNLSALAARGNSALPALYWRYFRIWIVLGIPAFLAFLAVFWLMVAKPA